MNLCMVMCWVREISLMVKPKSIFILLLTSLALIWAALFQQQHNELSTARSPFQSRSESNSSFIEELIHNWVPELLGRFRNFWATDPASVQLYLEQLLSIGAFWNAFGYSLTSHYCDSLHTYCEFVVIVSVVDIVSCQICCLLAYSLLGFILHVHFSCR